MIRLIRFEFAVTVAAFATALLIAAVVCSTAYADLLPPGGGARVPRPRPVPAPVSPDPTTGVPLSFSDDANASSSRLVIPKKFLEQAGWQKSAGGLQGDVNVAESNGPLRTMIAGLLLSAAAVSLIFIRRAGRSVKILGVLVVISVGALAASELLSPQRAEAARPRRNVSSKSVVLEIVDEGDAVKFVHGTGN